MALGAAIAAQAAAFGPPHEQARLEQAVSAFDFLQYATTVQVGYGCFIVMYYLCTLGLLIFNYSIQEKWAVGGTV